MDLIQGLALAYRCCISFHVSSNPTSDCEAFALSFPPFFFLLLLYKKIIYKIVCKKQIFVGKK